MSSSHPCATMLASSTRLGRTAVSPASHQSRSAQTFKAFYAVRPPSPTRGMQSR